MEIVTKSRNLSLTDFYAALQREYISYFVRSMIYPAEYVSKYKNFCALKKEKIDKISNKNSLPSIFNMMNLKIQYIDNFLNAYGLPNFEYRDKKSIEIMGRWDKEYWFSAGTSIKIKTDEEIVLSVVIKNISQFNKVVADVHNEVKQFRYEFISRIISDSLINF